MRARALVLPTLCLVIAGSALSAEAAPKKKTKPAPPVCNLVQDAKGDATQLYVLGEGSVPNEPALDIVTADVASNGKQMTTVLRVDKLARNSSGSPYGNIWYAYFNVGGIDFYTQAQSPLTGDVFTVGYVAPDTGLRTALPDNAATGVLDMDKNEVRVTFNLAQLTPQATAKPGSKITGLRGLSNRSAVRVVLQSDEAIGAKSYIEGSPSCVAVGK
ncbi:MAG TPA: hypothetical protein VNB94_08100 [Mycobacteriales bacterium]|nr:hypothetical protein [Mycobacteriales bacterium]